VSRDPKNLFARAHRLRNLASPTDQNIKIRDGFSKTMEVQKCQSRSTIFVLDPTVVKWFNDID